MIPIIVLMVNTAVYHDEGSTLNFVHEWGVVVFVENQPMICGSPWNESAQRPDFPIEMVVEAPVIWIHGEPFEGTFTVETVNGETITMIYPEPDVLTEETANWEISASSVIQANIEESILYEGPFAWAADFWRDVPSLPLLQKNTGITENFLYYECTVGQNFTGNFFNWSQDGNPVFTGTSVKEALLFTPYGAIPVTVHQDEFIPCDFPLGGEIDPQLAPDTFYRWANAKLEPSEITALWETWQPSFTEENSYWLVFPIPEEFNNEISTIHLETSDQRNVEYERLFLGAVRLRQP